MEYKPYNKQKPKLDQQAVKGEILHLKRLGNINDYQNLGKKQTIEVKNIGFAQFKNKVSN